MRRLAPLVFPLALAAAARAGQTAQTRGSPTSPVVALHGLMSAALGQAPQGGLSASLELAPALSPAPAPDSDFLALHAALERAVAAPAESARPAAPATLAEAAPLSDAGEAPRERAPAPPRPEDEAPVDVARLLSAVKKGLGGPEGMSARGDADIAGLAQRILTLYHNAAARPGELDASLPAESGAPGTAAATLRPAADRTPAPKQGAVEKLPSEQEARDRRLIEAALRLGEPRAWGLLGPRSPTAAFFVRFLRESGTKIRFDPTLGRETLGGYLQGIGLNVRLREASPEAVLTVLVHEAFHAWSVGAFEAHPRWRMEGADRWIQFEIIPRGLESRVWLELGGTPGLDVRNEHGGDLTNLAGIWEDWNTLAMLKIDPREGRKPDLHGYPRFRDDPGYSPGALVRREEEAELAWRDRAGWERSLRRLLGAGALAAAAFTLSPWAVLWVGAALAMAAFGLPLALRAADRVGMRSGGPSRLESIYARFAAVPAFVGAAFAGLLLGPVHFLYFGAAVLIARAALAARQYRASLREHAAIERDVFPWLSK
jgi:hypothetical protein